MKTTPPFTTSLISLALKLMLKTCRTEWNHLMKTNNTITHWIFLVDPPLSPYSDCSSPHHGHRDTSPPLTPYSDITSSCSDCESEPDQVPTHSVQVPKKKRQRTTFSPIEVWELERAFRRRPYLVDQDKKELVQKLGIPAKSVKVILFCSR